MTVIKPLIELNHISFSPVLKDVDLKLYRGQIVTVVGPNGAGKTTALKILLGLIQPTQGHIVKEKKLKIGYMPQKLFLDRILPLSVERFLSLSPQHHTVDQALEMVQARALKHRSLHVLSGGEMQRILLARAIMGHPDLLVLDEPDQGMDVRGQDHLYHLIQRLKEHLRCAVLLVSHNLHFVHASSDHVVCLNGHICCEGRPEEIKQDPAYAALFGLKKSDLLVSSLAPYHHHHDHDHS